jgi:hypothetical protein
MKLVKKPNFTCKTKHIEIVHCYIREKVQDGTIQISYIPMHEQIADLLTKPLGRIQFEKILEATGVVKSD